IGGNSLLAARVVARIRDALHVELPVRALFEQPTATGLALRIAAGGAEIGGDAPLVRVPRDGDVLASPAQLRLWVLEQLDPGSPAYHVPGWVRLRGALDEAALAAAVAELVRRHEALRTGFVERAGRVYQQIASEAIASSALLAISDGPLDARLTAVITQSFD